MSTFYVGLDNGISGAIAIIDPFGSVEAINFETIKIGKSNAIDSEWLYRRLALLQGAAEAEGALISVVAEQAQKFSPGKLALCSTWHCWGKIEATLSRLKIPYQPVNPQTWQKEMFRGIARVKGDDTGRISIEVCRRLYPTVSLMRTERTKKEDSGLSDAILIATYAKRAKI